MERVDGAKEEERWWEGSRWIDKSVGSNDWDEQGRLVGCGVCFSLQKRPNCLVPSHSTRERLAATAHKSCTVPSGLAGSSCMDVEWLQRAEWIQQTRLRNGPGLTGKLLEMVRPKLLPQTLHPAPWFRLCHHDRGS